MKLTGRIRAFSELGEILRNDLQGKNAKYSSELNTLIDTQHLNNPWFTPENVRMAISSIANELTPENLTKWTDLYPALNQDARPIRVGIIMAGNIPLAGFHDFMSVLISGNDIISKTSSKDADLIRFIGEILCEINPEFKNKIEFTHGTLYGFDAVIATGTDNSSRYFEYYFGKYPHIIRKNRNSIAFIKGNESHAELEALGIDVFSYFGLGCRNVSKLYVPEGYDFSAMINSWGEYSGVISHSKYAGNYDFSKAVYLVNKERFNDTGFLLLKEDHGLSSPVAVLYFQYFKSMISLQKETDQLKEKIQCITGEGFVPFGKAQSPALWDYADGVDTLEFLLKKNQPGIL
jgi:hypothetical protein